MAQQCLEPSRPCHCSRVLGHCHLPWTYAQVVVCVRAMVHVIHSCMHIRACISMRMTAWQSFGECTGGSRWVISLCINLHHQEEGVTKRLRPSTIFPIYEHTRCISVHPPKNHKTWYGGALRAHTCIQYISSDSDNKKGENGRAWPQKNQHAESLSWLERD